jgi:cation transport ATPase
MFNRQAATATQRLSRAQRQARADARLAFSLSLLMLTLAILATLASIATYGPAMAGNADADILCRLFVPLAIVSWCGFPFFAVMALLETRRF